MKNNKAKSKLKKIIIPLVVAVTIVATLCVSLIVGFKKNPSSSNSEYQAKIDKLSTQNESLHKDKVALNTQISELANQVAILSSSNDNYKSQISALSTQKTSLENQVLELENLKSQNEIKILDLNNEIVSLKNEILDLQLRNEDKTTRIAILNNRVVNLEALVDQFEDINAMHLVTISSLNSQIATLNSQIQTLSVQLFENSNTMDSYLKRIAELEKSIAYYDTFVSALESDTKAVVTFEFNNSVYNIQVVNKNSLVSVVSPTSTNYVVFNGWTIDGQPVDLSTYNVTDSIHVVADVTYKYDVNFVVDGVNYDTQVVESSNSAVLPINPTKDGYVFDGWTVDGITIENVDTYEIVRNTTFTAKFTKMHQVTFSYEDTILSTQSIRNGAFANVVSTPVDTEYKVFNGWKVDGIIVDVSTYAITKDTNFIAEIVEWCDVNFMVDSSIYDVQRVVLNTYATLPTAPTKTGYVFAGWTLNGTDVIDITTNQISSNTTYIARFEKLYNVTFKYGNDIISEQSILNGYSPSAVIPPADTERKSFNGWLVDGVKVDNVTSFVVTSDTIFVADITYSYLVEFISDGSIFASAYVVEDASASVPTGTPTKSQRVFKGWSIDSVNVVDISTVTINQDTTFIAVFGNIVVNDFVVSDYNVTNGSGMVAVPYDNFELTSNTLGSYDLRTYSTIRVEFDYYYNFVEDEDDITNGVGIGTGHGVVDVAISWDGSSASARPSNPEIALFSYVGKEDTYTFEIKSNQFIRTDFASNFIHSSEDVIILDFVEPLECTYKNVFTSKIEGYLFISDVSNVTLELIP